jgi:hypothetical protein
VHRQVATDEELEEEASPDAPEAGPDTTADVAIPEPANAALAALFQSTVIDKWDVAVAALGASPPDPATAQPAIDDALSAVSALMPTYTHSDPPLASELARVGNALLFYYEMIEPHLHGARDLPDVHQAMLAGNIRTVSLGLRDRLH